MKLLHALAFTVIMATPAAAQNYSAAQLMVDSGVDLVFDQFGPMIAESAEIRAVTNDAHFIATWERTARAAFEVESLNSALEHALGATLSDAAMSGLQDFYSSEFGKEVVELEREILLEDAAGQAMAVADGLELYEGASETRRAMIEELLVLAGAELTPELVRQSSRSLMLGMSLANGSDIEIPWETIDAQMDAMMPAIEAEIRSYQQALTTYTYRDMSDAELEDYLVFLRSEPARDFYNAFVPAVTQIVSAAMAQFGQQLALNLTQKMT